MEESFQEKVRPNHKLFNTNVDKRFKMCYNKVKEEGKVKFIITVGILAQKKPGALKREFVAKWPPMEVEALEKWDALAAAVEKLGVGKYAPMSDFWRGSSIKIKEKKKIKKMRYQEPIPENLRK